MALSRPSSHRTVLLAKIVALALLFEFAPFAWFPEIRLGLQTLMPLTNYGRIPAIYVVVVLVSFAGFCITPFLRSTAIRVPLVTLFLLAFAFDRVVLSLSGSHLDTSFVRILWQAREMAGAAIGAYQKAILLNIAGVAVLSGPLAWPFTSGLRNRFALAPLAALVLVTCHYWSWGGMVEGYPAPLVLPARVAWILHAPQTRNDLPLKPVPHLPVTPSPFRKIVFIVDESVRGDYLTINNGQIDTTPFLEQSAGRLTNFGVAISASNCSFQSRWMLRRGIRPWQLPAHDSPSAVDPVRIDEGPRTTVWQFARSAGFKTVHLDSWSSYYGRFHDGMTVAERSSIDQHVAIDDVVPYERDLEAARSLVSIVNDPERTFVLVDKIGAHFPYDSWSPPDFNRFRRSDGVRFEYARNTRDDRIGSYKNALAWSVDEFFRELLEHTDLRGVLMVYTSDHGQDLERVQTHCTVSNTQPSEAWVPLFAIAEGDDFGRALVASAARSHDEATHFDIFPTLLIAMGYDAQWVTDIYGPSLLQIPTDRPRRFLIGDVMGPGWRRWIDGAP